MWSVMVALLPPKQLIEISTKVSSSSVTAKRMGFMGKVVVHKLSVTRFLTKLSLDQ